MNVNIPYSDMTLAVQGPENPFKDRTRFDNQNALAGHVEEQEMTEHAFRQQHLTYSILGYSANPSADPNAPKFIGAVDKAQANGFRSIDMIGSTHAEKKAAKRKRNGKGNVDAVDGDDAYVGPWASWQSDQPSTSMPFPTEGPSDNENEEESEEEPSAIRKKTKAKRGTDICPRHFPRHRTLLLSLGCRIASYQKFAYTHGLATRKEYLLFVSFPTLGIYCSVDRWTLKSR